MNDNSLGDYRSDPSRLPEEEGEETEKEAGIPASMYHQELTTLKIEKLSQRITIISIILPCIIIAVLAFAYIDMKERVVDVDETQGTQVARIAQTLEEKLNALDVRIAKAKFELDEKLALIEKKSQALENQAAKMSSAKADLAAVNQTAAKLEKRIKANAGQDKTTLAALKKIQGKLQSAIKTNNAQFKSKANQIKEEIQLFKEEFDTRLLELSAYDEQIAQLTKSTSLLDKAVKTLKQDATRSITLEMDRKLDALRLSLEKKILAARVKSSPAKKAVKPQAAVPSSPKAPAKAGAKDIKPTHSGSGEKAGSDGISEQNLTQ